MTDEYEQSLYDTHAKHIRAAKPCFEKLITETTGWQGVEGLADWMIELLIANQGGSALQGTRPPCWQEHAPQTIAQFTNSLAQASGLAADDPVIQLQVAAYRQQLRTQFGL